MLRFKINRVLTMYLILFFYNRRLAKETSQQSDAQFLHSFHCEVRTLKTKNDAVHACIQNPITFT